MMTEEREHGSTRFIEIDKNYGKKLVFVTNNSTKSRRQNAQKFQSLRRFDYDEIFTSSFAAVMYLKINKFSPEKKVNIYKVYVIGGDGILEELKYTNRDARQLHSHN